MIAMTPGLHAGQHSKCIVCEAALAAPSLDEQIRQSWQKCANCGVVGRKHSAQADHPFTAAPTGVGA